MSEQMPAADEHKRVSGGDTINLSKSSVERIDAALVRLDRSVIENVNADEAELSQSLIAQASAERIDIRDSITLSLNADTAYLQGSAQLVAKSRETVVQNSTVGLLYGDRLTLDNARSNIVVARQVTGGPIHTAVLLAGKVEGPVEPVLDTPRALLAGLSAGIAIGLVWWLRSLLSRE